MSLKLLSDLEENDVEVSSNNDGDSSWVYDSSDDSDRSLYLNCYKKTKNKYYKNCLSFNEDQSCKKINITSKMNESHISEETSGSDPCELNADACSFSNEDCRENVEDCLNPEATASDVTAGCTAMRVNAPFLSNEHNYKAEMNLKHIHYHCNKDCRIQEANVWLRDEKLCTVKVTADADEGKENVEDCLNAQATASDVATLCKDMDMNASPILDCSAAVATLCRATDMNESPFPEETYSSDT